MPKPFSEACAENQRPILEVIRPWLEGVRSVLEVGSGTGQHAVYFARAMGHLVWQTSDRGENHSGIQAWIRESGLQNVLDPLDLDVTAHWPAYRYDAVFSANTAHIMSAAQIAAMFRGVAGALVEGGVFLLYGPFKYHGRHTAESNARFDALLRQRDPASGVKDVDDLESFATTCGLQLVADRSMPVNNRTLIWRRTEASNGSSLRI